MPRARTEVGDCSLQGKHDDDDEEMCFQLTRFAGRWMATYSQQGKIDIPLYVSSLCHKNVQRLKLKAQDPTSESRRLSIMPAPLPPTLHCLPRQLKPLAMPERARRLHPLHLDHVPPELLRRLLRHHRLRRHLRVRQQSGLHEPRVQQQHRDAVVLEIHRQRLADAVDGGFGRAVRVVPAGGVVADGADARGDDADFGGWGGGAEVGEQGLGDEEGAVGVDGEGGVEDGRGAVGQGVDFGASGDAWWKG